MLRLLLVKCANLKLEMVDKKDDTPERLTPKNDTRNVVNRFKGMSEYKIIEILDREGVDLEIAFENTLRDYNIGTIVRTANAFGVRHVHVVGRRQWNKRGAMMTDAYMHIHYHSSIEGFAAMMRKKGLSLVAVDNVKGSKPLHKTDIPKKSVLIFGQEGPGLSEELLDISDFSVEIEQFGSTRSLNVGVASGIVMYAWLERHKLR